MHSSEPLWPSKPVAAATFDGLQWHARESGALVSVPIELSAAETLLRVDVVHRQALGRDGKVAEPDQVVLEGLEPVSSERSAEQACGATPGLFRTRFLAEKRGPGEVGVSWTAGATGNVLLAVYTWRGLPIFVPLTPAHPIPLEAIPGRLPQP